MTVEKIPKPEALKKSPALRALYNNLQKSGATRAQDDAVAEPQTEDAASGDPILALAVKIDAAVKEVRHDGWRGVQAKERVIKRALFEILHDDSEVERMFLIIRAQGEY